MKTTHKWICLTYLCPSPDLSLHSPSYFVSNFPKFIDTDIEERAMSPNWKMGSEAFEAPFCFLPFLKPVSEESRLPHFQGLGVRWQSNSWGFIQLGPWFYVFCPSFRWRILSSYKATGNLTGNQWCWLAMCLGQSRGLRARDTLPALPSLPPVHAVFQQTSPTSPPGPKSAVTYELMRKHCQWAKKDVHISDLLRGLHLDSCSPGHKAISACTVHSPLLKERTALLPSWSLALRG